jgi:pyruvate dehydrogenase E2 component (dihydrolipoamide acetyltransferase)
LSEKARSRGLPMTDMEGGCISISSLGGIGGTAFTPIVNAPEVAILGITKAEWKPRRGPDDAIEWRLKAPLSLSYDHRVINGADAARFLRHLDDVLAAPQRL